MEKEEWKRGSNWIDERLIKVGLLANGHQTQRNASQSNRFGRWGEPWTSFYFPLIPFLTSCQYSL